MKVKPTYKDKTSSRIWQATWKSELQPSRSRWVIRHVVRVCLPLDFNSVSLFSFLKYLLLNCVKFIRSSDHFKYTFCTFASLVVFKLLNSDREIYALRISTPKYMSFQWVVYYRSAIHIYCVNYCQVLSLNPISGTTDTFTESPSSVFNVP